MGKSAVLLQADPDDDEAKDAEMQENDGGPCAFEASVQGKKLRLRPIAFVSQRNTEAEQSWHSYVGEAATGLWAMTKFKRYLMGKPFTWITDCSGIRQFF